MALGSRLRSARVKANLTIAEVSARTGIGESSLSEFENEKREPKISQLALLGAVYCRSLSFFLDDGEVADQPVLWRSKPEEQAPLVECEFLKLCEQYRLLEEWNNDFITPPLPRLEVGRRALRYEDVAELAHRVRSELNLGERPAFVLLRVLEEECGIKIFHREFVSSGTAACVKSEQVGWAILLNGSDAEFYRNFSLAQELFYLLVWDQFRGVDGRSTEGTPEQEEALASAFASCLLIPGEALRRMVERKRNPEGKISLVDVAEIAYQFGAPVEALIRRIHYVYNFGSSREEETANIIQAVQNRLNAWPITDGASGRPPKLPDRYRMLAVQALRNGEMSPGKFMEFMEVSRREAMKYMEVEEYAFGEIQLTPA